jgi:hypothetical protein
MPEVLDEANALAEEAKKPGVFNILDVVKGRGYPSEDVNVYLDESVAYEAAIIKEKIDELEPRIIDSQEAAAQVVKLEKQLAPIMERLKESKYVFTISGIPEGIREDLLNQATEVYPVEYTESKNPFSGELTRAENENTERDRLFTNLLWKKHITKITAPDGSVQENLDDETVIELRRSLPIAGIGLINQSLERVRISSAIFLSKVNEDFLAKS